MQERRAGGLWVVIAYAVALTAAVGVGFWLSGRHPIFVAAAADLAGTVVVFAFSLGFNNSSFYDPYWSVAPIPMAIYFMSRTEGTGWREFLIVGLVTLWGVRLTFNWFRRWKGLADEDFRYRAIRRRSGRAYWPASFASIHLFPTVAVFVGCLSLYPALTAPGSGALFAVAGLLTLGAVWIEAAADRQLHRFRQQAKGGVLTSGLWAWSRHPNYLGEILFWWGLYLFALSSDPAWWWTVVGPLGITGLFVFVSIPWIERRKRAGRPDYSRAVAAIPVLFPRPPRHRPD